MRDVKYSEEEMYETIPVWVSLKSGIDLKTISIIEESAVNQVRDVKC